MKKSAEEDIASSKFELVTEDMLREWLAERMMQRSKRDAPETVYDRHGIIVTTRKKKK